MKLFGKLDVEIISFVIQHQSSYKTFPRPDSISRIDIKSLETLECLLLLFHCNGSNNNISFTILECWRRI